MKKNDCNSEKITALLQAWQDRSLDVRRRAAEALDKLGAWGATNRCVAIINCHNTPDEGSEPNLPPMPSEQFIRESIERQYQNDFVDRSSAQDSPTDSLQNVISNGQESFLKNHTLLYIHMQPRAFDRYAGLYAYDGTQLIHLNGPSAKNHLTEIFCRETLNFDQVDPVWLVDLLSRALIPLRRMGYSLRGHFVVEPALDLEYQSAITEPSVHATEDGGWNVHFWSQFSWGGCTAKTPLLFEHTIVISPEFEITYEQPNPEPEFD